MRSAFIRTLIELADNDSRILLLTADLGYMVVEPFLQRFPKRFFNVGVAEQNMIAVATGLAEAGFIPFVYSIAPFAVLRPFEFIRNGPILHQLPVRIVGIGAGMDYGTNGLSHYSIEDLAVMRSQPGISIIAPADAEQARTALRATAALTGPIYYRLGKDDNVVIQGLEGRFELGRAQLVREGTDVVFISTGSITTEVIEAAEELERKGVSAAVVVLASIQPAPTEDIIALLTRFRLAITVEAHYRVGGIGSLVSEIAAEQMLGSRVVRCGIRTLPIGKVGTQNYLYQAHDLGSSQLVRTVLQERALTAL